MITANTVLVKTVAVCNYYYNSLEFADGGFYTTENEFTDRHIAAYKMVFSYILEGNYAEADKILDWLLSEFPAR